MSYIHSIEKARAAYDKNKTLEPRKFGMGSRAGEPQGGYGVRYRNGKLQLCNYSASHAEGIPYGTNTAVVAEKEIAREQIEFD